MKAAGPLAHVGYHKTATTWLQKSLFPLAVSHTMVPRPIIKECLLEPPGLAFDAERARNQLLRAAGGLPPLISEENLSGGIHAGGLNGLVGPEVARRLHAVFPDARIVIGIRSQFSLIASAYSSYVDAGGTYGPLRYVFPEQYCARGERRIFRAWFNLAHLEFDRLISYYRSLFGADSVHVFVYERFRNDPTAAALELAREIGLTLDGTPIDPGTINLGFGTARLRLTRLLNMFSRGWVDEKLCIANVPGARRLRDALWRLDRYSGKPTPAELLGQEIIDAVARRYAESNERLRGMGIDLDGLGYPGVR